MHYNHNYRIVVVSSTAMVFSDLNTDDIMLQKYFNPSKIHTKFATNLFYNNSKMANCLFVKDLGRRLRGKGVTSYSVCPGISDTNIFEKYSTMGTIMTKLWWAITVLSPAKVILRRKNLI